MLPVEFKTNGPILKNLGIEKCLKVLKVLVMGAANYLRGRLKHFGIKLIMKYLFI